MCGIVASGFFFQLARCEAAVDDGVGGGGGGIGS